MADGGAERVFWRYDPLSSKPGSIALQSFANLSRSLGGSFSNSVALTADSTLQAVRFRGSGKLTVVAWYGSGGDQFEADCGARI